MDFCNCDVQYKVEAMKELYYFYNHLQVKSEEIFILVSAQDGLCLMTLF